MMKPTNEANRARARERERKRDENENENKSLTIQGCSYSLVVVLFPECRWMAKACRVTELPDG